MCGRYVLDVGLEALKTNYKADIHDEGYWDYGPEYNICPTDVVPVLAFGGEKQRKLVPMRWGLHPHWSKQSPADSSYGPLFNARIETAVEKPSFRTPWRRRRALIPATHWFEWTGEQGGKVPWCIKPEAGGVFAFAGLWDRWRVDEGIELLSFTILTTESSTPISQLHHRMPVRLPEERWNDWLDPDTAADKTLEAQLSAEDLIFWEVGRAVNSNRADGPDLIAPSV